MFEQYGPGQWQGQNLPVPYGQQPPAPTHMGHEVVDLQVGPGEQPHPPGFVQFDDGTVVYNPGTQYHQHMAQQQAYGNAYGQPRPLQNVHQAYDQPGYPQQYDDYYVQPRSRRLADRTWSQAVGRFLSPRHIGEYTMTKLTLIAATGAIPVEAILEFVPGVDAIEDLSLVMLAARTVSVVYKLKKRRE